MKTRILVLLCFLLANMGLVNMALAEGQIWVITNSNTPIDALTRKEVKNTYLGAPLSFSPKTLMVNEPDNLRQLFNTKVIGLSESRLRSFIAQMRFSGRALPIEDVDNVNAVITQVQSEPGVIGYVPSNTELPGNIKIIYSL